MLIALISLAVAAIMSTLAGSMKVSFTKIITAMDNSNAAN
jgi:Flp pilus assembly pilin Flp